MNTTELCELFRTNPDCSLIATTASVLQINCLNAAIRRIKKSGEKLTGFVFRLTSSTLGKNTYDLNQFQLDADIRYIDNCSKIEYSRKSERKDLFRKLAEHRNNKSKNLYIVGADLMHPLLYAVLEVYGENRNILFAEVDDGTINYIPLIKTRIHDRVLMRKSRLVLVNTRIAFVEILRGLSIKLVQYLVRKERGYLDCRLLDVNNGKARKNDEIARYFIEALTENAQNIDQETS